MALLERTFKEYLVRIMGTRWDVQSHEDRYSDSIPDLSYAANGVNGWIELKQIKNWPKKDDTLVKPDHYTAGQVSWIKKRGRMGGHCFVMVKVSNEYFIFSYTCARDIRCGIIQSQYYEKCLKWWKGNIEPSELISILTKSGESK